MLGLLLRSRRRRAARRAGEALGRAADTRLRIAAPLRKQLNKAFPEHWSFMLGEIALYSFIILLLTGTYLTFFFQPSDTKVVYHGRYRLLDGVTMSDAYRSTLRVSFDVRGGLLIRQLHHWAALLFLAAIIVHMCRIFFTGAFRKPREMNWLIGLAMTGLGMVEGFAGYSLPDDLLSGTGLRIASAVLLSVPVIGTWLQFLVFGGPFPGHQIFERMYIAHVLLIPGILVVLIAAHLTMVVRQKHTDFPGRRRTETEVAGERLFPTYAMKSIGFFSVTTGVLLALAGLTQINPVWLYGPYNPAQVSSDSQPDVYVWFLDGSLRLFPPWEIRAAGHDVPNVFWSGVVLPFALFALAAIYPWVEARIRRDHAKHNVLERPRDAPNRTAVGGMALTFWVVLSLAAAQDVIAKAFDLPLDNVIWALRIGLLVLPPIAFLIARSACRRLQDHERMLLASGASTGRVVQLPNGDWAEVTVPLDDISSGEPVLPYEAGPSARR